MAAVTICSDFGAQKNKVSHCLQYSVQATFYNVHAYLLQCTRLPFTMYTLTFYNVHPYLLQCICLPFTMHKLTF